MNGLLDNQRSGNDWELPIQVMLHEHSQHKPAEVRITPSQRLFIRDIEVQMQHFEADYRAAVAEVRKLYVMPADSSVFHFLNDHRALPQLLIEAFPHLKRYFTENVFSLRSNSDEYGSQDLYADVLWKGDARDAVRLLDRFEDEWWIPNSRSAHGVLTFTYRLI